MPEKILVLDNLTFFVICDAAAEDEKAIRNALNVHWFLLDDYKGGFQEILSDHTCETIVLDADWIAKHAENKYLGLQYRQNGNTHRNSMFFVQRCHSFAEKKFFYQAEYMRYVRQHKRYIHPEKEMIQNA